MPRAKRHTLTAPPKDRPILATFHVGNSDLTAEGEVIWNAHYEGFVPTALIASILYPHEIVGWREVRGAAERARAA